MNDFTNMIGKMFAEGKTSEDIAKMMSDALTEAEKQKGEAETKSKRDKKIEDMKQIFTESYEEGTLDLADLAAGITIAAANDESLSEYLTTVDDIETYHEHTLRTIKNIPITFKAAHKITDSIKKARATGNVREAAAKDTEIIKEFIKEIFGEKGED